MGTRGANRDAMVQHLEDDAWVDTLISEAYADTWAGRTSAHHTRKHVNRRMRTLFHVGADDDRPDGFDTATLYSFDDVDGFLEHPNADGSVRNQILIYAMVLIAGVRIDGTGSITMIEGWANDQEVYPIVDEMESDTRFGKLRLRVNEICKQRTSAATGAAAGAPAGPGGPAGSVTAHTPVLSKMAKSCDTDSQKYRKLMQWLQEDPKNLVPSAIEKALEDHPSTLLQQWQLFAASNGSLTGGRRPAVWQLAHASGLGLYDGFDFVHHSFP